MSDVNALSHPKHEPLSNIGGTFHLSFCMFPIYPMLFKCLSVFSIM